MLVLLAAGLTCGSGGGAAWAATISVSPGTVAVAPGDGACSIREALLNAAADTDASGGDCAAGGGADVVVLAAGAVYTLHDGPYTQATGLPALVGPLVIRGNGSVVERAAGGPPFRLVYVAPGSGEVRVERLTLRDGRAVSLDGTPGDGGALLNDGVLVLDGCTIEANSGREAVSSGGAMTIIDSTIRGNSGAGLSASSANTTVVNALISENTGDGIRYESDDRLVWLIVERSRITDNGGSGIDNEDAGRVRILGTTITGHGDGDGSVFLSDPTDVFTRDDGLTEITGSLVGGVRGEHVGQTRLLNSTVSEVVLYRAHASLVHVTVTGQIENASYYGEGGVGLRNTLVVGTCWSAEVGEADSEPNDAVGSRGFNLVGAGSGCPSDGPGDLVVAPTAFYTTVLEASPADHGGPTPSVALLPGSIALDAAPCTDADGNAVTEDQRGEPRPAGPSCDIGAFELAAVADTTPPVITVAARPLVLWPPDHRHRTVSVADVVTGVSEGDRADVVVAAVTSDEADDGRGDGGTTGDVVVADCRTVRLRAERAGRGDGRVYTVHVALTDAAGNVGTAAFRVVVPQARRQTAVASPVASRVESGCSMSAERADSALAEAAVVRGRTPTAYALRTTAPNPFAQATTVRFDVPERAFATLEVLDVLGRRVALLFDREVEPGTYEATWDGTSVGGAAAGGVYLYRLRAGPFTRTRAMTLLR